MKSSKKILIISWAAVLLCMAVIFVLSAQKGDESENLSDGLVFVSAARDGKKAAIVISNTNECDVEVAIDVAGFPTTEILTHRIDEHNRNTQTGEKFGDGTFSVPARRPRSCAPP